MKKTTTTKPIRMPAGNMFWKDIPKDACVIDRGHWFEVKRGRKRYVAHWEGRFSHEAQTALGRRAKSDAKKHAC